MGAEEETFTEPRAEREQRAAALALQRTADLEKGAYDRGVAAAELASRLDRTDDRLGRAERHLEQINGSQAETVGQLSDIKQQLRDIARDVAGEENRSAKSSARRFTRLQSAGILLMAAFAFCSLLVLVIQALGH
jgi:hypothetical protein